MKTLNEWLKEVDEVEEKAIKGDWIVGGDDLFVVKKDGTDIFLPPAFDDDFDITSAINNNKLATILRNRYKQMAEALRVMDDGLNKIKNYDDFDHGEEEIAYRTLSKVQQIINGGE